MIFYLVISTISVFHIKTMAPDKRGIHIDIFVFLFLHKNIEALLMSTHNMFLWRHKKNISTFWSRNSTICSYEKTYTIHAEHFYIKLRMMKAWHKLPTKAKQQQKHLTVSIKGKSAHKWNSLVWLTKECYMILKYFANNNKKKTKKKKQKINKKKKKKKKNKFCTNAVILWIKTLIYTFCPYI